MLNILYMTTMYYLFGQQAVEFYYSSDFAEVLEQLKNGLEYVIFEFKPSETNPGELLDAYDGWDGYASITAEEFKQIAIL